MIIIAIAVRTGVMVVIRAEIQMPICIINPSKSRIHPITLFLTQRHYCSMYSFRSLSALCLFFFFVISYILLHHSLLCNLSRPCHCCDMIGQKLLELLAFDQTRQTAHTTPLHHLHPFHNSSWSYSNVQSLLRN